jgi:hypothetical protein
MPRLPRSLLKGALIVLTAAWELYAIQGASEAGVGFVEVALGVPAAVLLAVVWTIVWTAPGVWTEPGSPGIRPRRVLLGLSFPVLAAALVLIYLSSQSPLNPLFRLRFAASQAALTRVAQELEGGAPGLEPRRIGLFQARYVAVMSPDEVRLLTADCGVVDQCGLAYRPRARPTSSRYAHIQGPWYLIYEPF